MKFLISLHHLKKKRKTSTFLNYFIESAGNPSVLIMRILFMPYVLLVKRLHCGRTIWIPAEAFPGEVQFMMSWDRVTVP